MSGGTATHFNPVASLVRKYPSSPAKLLVSDIDLRILSVERSISAVGFVTPTPTLPAISNTGLLVVIPGIPTFRKGCLPDTYWAIYINLLRFLEHS